MNKGYAFGFLLILAVLVLGSYVAFTSFQSNREALLAEPTSTPKAQSTVTVRTPRVTTPTATLTTIPLPELGVTATLTAAAQPATAQPANTPAGKPPKRTAVPAATTPAPPTPTAIAIGSYEFRLAGPPGPDAGWTSCCYIAGTVRDAAGNGLEGIRVQVFNQWNPPVVAVTKGGADLGRYDVPIGRDRVAWSVMLVNDAGDPISTKTDLLFDPAVANAYRVDWRRTH